METFGLEPTTHPRGVSAPDHPAVSVIVPVHNASGVLSTLLDALDRQQVVPGTFEVIVADDGSDDGTPALAESRGATVVRGRDRRGSYAARNAALERARGDVLAFTDADCIPHPDWIERGLATLDRTRADIVAGHIDVPLGTRPTAAALLGLAKHHLDQRFHVEEQGYGATANLWVRRKVIERVGPFDPEITSGGDGEFCRRATSEGETLHYDSHLVIEHPPRSRALELAQKQWRIGFGVAQLHGRDRVERLPPIWSRPGAYVPRPRIRGLDVIEAHGHRMGFTRRVRVATVQYLFSQLPLAFGNLAGFIHERRLARGARNG